LIERAMQGVKESGRAFIGHNRGGRRTMYAIVFDLDTLMLQANDPGASWNNAYTDIRNYLVQRGFEWRQGSTYFGDESVDAVKCVRVVQKLSKKFAWFAPSVRDIRMLRIEENNDLLPAITEEDED
jgi:virulence-associated protein VapD